MSHIFLRKNVIYFFIKKRSRILVVVSLIVGTHLEVDNQVLDSAVLHEGHHRYRLQEKPKQSLFFYFFIVFVSENCGDERKSYKFMVEKSRVFDLSVSLVCIVKRGFF